MQPFIQGVLNLIHKVFTTSAWTICITFCVALGGVALAQETRPPTNPVGSANTATKPQPLSELEQLVKRARECLDKGDYVPALEAALAADALIASGSQSNSVLRVQSLAFISEICLKKQSFAEAEGYARRALQVSDSLPNRPPGDHLRAYSFLVSAFRSQGRNAEAIHLADGITTAPPESLAAFDLESVSILIEGAEAAAALKDYPTAIRFKRLQAELEKIAIRDRKEDSQIEAMRKESTVRSQLRLGMLLFDNNEYAESVRVLAVAREEARQIGLSALEHEITLWIGRGQVANGQIGEGIATFKGVLPQLEDGTSAKSLCVLALASARENQRSLISEPNAQPQITQSLDSVARLKDSIKIQLSPILIDALNGFYDGDYDSEFAAYSKVLGVLEAELGKDDRAIIFS